MNTNVPGYISMRPVRFGDGTYGVEAQVKGLQNQQQAESAMDYLMHMLCGEEIFAANGATAATVTPEACP